MIEDNYNDGDNDFQIVDLDESPKVSFVVQAWRTFYGKHPTIKKWLKQGGIGVAVLVCLVIFLWLPPIHAFWWSKLSGVPADAISVQAYGKEITVTRQSDGSQLWQHTLDGKVVGQPQIAGNSVYLLSDQQTFYSFDKATGAFRWVYRSSDGAITPPVVSGQTIYSVSRGYLKAFRADTGLLLWQTALGKNHQIDPIALNDDAIYLTLDHKEIVMLRRQDGTRSWQLSLSETMTSPLALAGSRLYYTADQHHLVARDSSSGALLWQHELSSVFADSQGQSHLYLSGSIILYINQDRSVHPLVVSQGIANIIVENKALALNAANGSMLWSSALDGWPVRSAVLSHDTVTLLTLNGTVSMLDLPSGKLRWQVALGNAYTVTMVADNTTLHACSANEGCVTLNAQSGFFLSHYYRASSFATSPLIENGRMYVTIASTRDPQSIGLLAFNARNDAQLWLYHTLIPLSAPVYYDQRVLITDIQGQTYIFNAANGSLLKVLS